MWRQGDLFIAVAERLPGDASRVFGGVLAEGEFTGHAHRLECLDTALVYRRGSDQYLHVTAVQAVIVHEEHGPVALAPGVYRVWRQREYTPERLRTVCD